MKAETIKFTGIDPTLPLTNMCGSSMLAGSALLAAYECGNTSAAAVYDVSLTTVDIKSLLPCITLVAPMDYWLCVSSVGPCVISCQMFVKSEFPLDSALV